MLTKTLAARLFDRRYASLMALLLAATGSIWGQVLSPPTKKTVDWSNDWRPLEELADEARQKGITTVILNRPYFLQQVEFPPLNVVSDALSIPDVHILLLRDEEKAAQVDDDGRDFMTYIKFSVVENLTGKPLNRDDSAHTPDQMSPANDGELIYLERGGSLSLKGVTFVHSATDLSFFRPNEMYLAIVWVVDGMLAFPTEPRPAFLVSASGTLHPMAANSPVARDVRLNAGNNLSDLRLYIAQRQDSAFKQ